MKRFTLLILYGVVGMNPAARGQSKAFAPTVELRNAGANKWRSIGPEGGPIRALSVDPHSGTIFATTSALQGVDASFQSVNKGASWAPSIVPSGVLIFDPQDPNTIYALNAGIAKSTDGGTSWKLVNSGLPPIGLAPPGVNVLAIDPLNPSTLYGGTWDGVFKSIDGGASWNPANTGLPPTDPEGYYSSVHGLVIDPQNPSTLYAVADPPNAPGGLLFKSIDGGTSWSQLGSGLPQSDITLAIDPQNPSTLYAGTASGVFKSTNGGQDWNSVSAGLPVPFERYSWWYSLAIDPRAPATLYAWAGNLTGNGIFKSTNGGSSWSEALSGLPAGTTVGALVFDAAESATLYAGTGVGVYKTVDGGVSWAAANSGLSGIRISDVAVAPRDPGTLYAATFYGLLKTTDEGTNWNPTNLVRVSNPLTIDPQTSTFFAAGCIASTCGLVKSADGGTSGSVTIQVADGYGISALAIDPRKSNSVYATSQDNDFCDDGTLHKSVDEGITWSHALFKDIGVLASCVFALMVDPQNSDNLYAAFENGGVFKSTDGGATWNAANSGLSPGSSSYSAAALAIDPTSPRTVYTVSSAGVFKSSDGGMNWNPASAGLPDWSGEWGNVLPRLAIDPQDPARIYLGIGINGVYHVFQSSDGGGSWTDSGFPLSHCLGICGLAVSSQASSTVYAGTSDVGLFALRRGMPALEKASGAKNLR